MTRSGRASRVLVVDDDDRFASTVRDLLREEGYEVEMAVSGKDAMARILEFSPDVLVLDLMMARPTSGYDVLAWLKSRGSSTRVVVLTGDDDWQPYEGVVKLRKPCTLESLLECVAAALEAPEGNRKRDR